MLGKKEKFQKQTCIYMYMQGFPGGSASKESACNAGDLGLIPASWRFPGEGNGHTLQHSCLGNRMDRGLWRAIVHWVTESDLTGWLTRSLSYMYVCAYMFIHTYIYLTAVLCLVTQSCPTLCGPMDCSLPGSSVPGDSPGKNAWVGSLSHLQGIFPTQGSNPGLLNCRRILDQL